MISRTRKAIYIRLLFISTVLSLFCDNVSAQPLSPQEIKNQIQLFKTDERGPYQAIRWFCPDGSMLPPNERCPQPGGIQHALPKSIVQRMARENHIFLGQILAGTPYEDFWDAASQNSRLKQYQLEKYLTALDDGWIFRRARYYRGAVQAEDEEAWGVKFLTWLLAQDEVVSSQYLLIRQACKDIPHKAGEDRWQNIRALAKAISDSLPSFVSLRVKIHGQPEFSDVQRVREFLASNTSRIPQKQKDQLLSLLKQMEQAYQESSLQSLTGYLSRLRDAPQIAEALRNLLRSEVSTEKTGLTTGVLVAEKSRQMADLLWRIRLALPQIQSATSRLTLMDLSIDLQSIFYKTIQYWKPITVGGLLTKNMLLCKAAAGCGYLERWEWEKVAPLVDNSKYQEDIPLDTFMQMAEYSSRIVEWGTLSLRAVYLPVVSDFSEFESLSAGYIDELVRSSVLLPLGETAGKLADLVAYYTNASNRVMNIRNQNQIRGLNPGFSLGELQVVTGDAGDIQFQADKIYALLRPLADMKPVAGIMTVTEGNLVSHVQLLARNLGIPNAVVSSQCLNELVPFSGQKVFYAVSPRGAVLMEPAGQMTAAEKDLVEVKKRSEERILVPAKKLNLGRLQLTSLRNLRATDSGKICGPKAANLGQLKSLFPDNVVEGFIIPFGVFRQHLDQLMPGQNRTFWQFMQETFSRADSLRNNSNNPDNTEQFVLQRLALLRAGIQNMSFLPDFQAQLQQRFVEIFGQAMGRVPVFVRSDTNMEDLKDFTGAGLNLTVFNVVEREKIFQAIRDVWASPYSERSYRWRQKYLLNSENVFPSILIIPSVNVEKSGVMITTGVSSGNGDDITIAFSRGAGGAVEGQIAESYLLQNDGTDLLLSPSRETSYTSLPVTGGVNKVFTQLNSPILSKENRDQLRTLASVIKQKLPGQPGIETDGPFDVELGFEDTKIWLFQVRPYVVNKKVRSTEYLQSLDPRIQKDQPIDQNKPIPIAN
jgi:hypothetical protein